jgi:putative ABC transport system permease protein
MKSRVLFFRKSLGSSRLQVMGQFLGETTLITVFAVVLSLGVAQIALTLLNPFLELKLQLNFSGDSFLWIYLISITVGVSLLSGLYPSFIMSGFKPVLALKNQISNKSSSGYILRRSLAVLQFAISQFFIMGTIILLSQMNFFRKQNLGFEKDAVVVMPIPERVSPGYHKAASKMRALRDQIMQLSGVEAVNLSSTPPSSGAVNGTGFYFGGEDESKRRDTQVKQVDGNYLSLYDIDLVVGTNLDDSDTTRGSGQ